MMSKSKKVAPENSNDASEVRRTALRGLHAAAELWCLKSQLGACLLHRHPQAWVPQACANCNPCCLLQSVFLTNVRVVKAEGFLPVLASKKGIISTNGIEMLDGEKEIWAGRCGGRVPLYGQMELKHAA